MPRNTKVKMVKMIRESLLESEESHWNRPERMLSKTVDRQVVHYLRRKLYMRLERRLGELGSSTDDGGSSSDSTPEYRSKHRRESGFGNDSRDLFNKYSDLGEKLHSNRRHGSATATATAASMSTAHRHHRTVNGVNHSNADRHLSHSGSLHDDELSSEINDDDVDSVVLPRISKSHDNNLSTICERNEREKSLFTLTKVAFSEQLTIDTDSVPDTNRPVVSPVATPLIARPETRENIDIVLHDRMCRILGGQVHLRCPQGKKNHKLYVISGQSDCDVERTHLVEKVYPQLREDYRRQGRELLILDLHFGTRNDVFDDHCMADLCRTTIRSSISGSKDTHALIVMGQRFGPYLLPTEIDVDEFEEILELARIEEEHQIAQKKREKAEAEEIERLAASDEVQNNKSSENELVKKSSGLPRRDTNIVYDADRQFEPLQIFRKHARSLVFGAKVVRYFREESETAISYKIQISPEFIATWYRRDDNCSPPIYRLQNISTGIPDITRNDVARRNKARLDWSKTAGKLQAMLQRVSKRRFTDEESLKKYFTSLLEMEIETCIEEGDESVRPVFVARMFDNLRTGLYDLNMRRYVDMYPGKSELNVSMIDRLEYVRDQYLASKIPQSSRHEFSIPWAKDGIIPADNRAHNKYLDRMCKVILESVQANMTEDDELLELIPRDVSEPTRRLMDEVSHHVCRCHESARTFHGCKQLLTTMKSYARSDSAFPMIIHGKAGCGKTSLMARAAKDVHRWVKSGPSPAVVVRHIGCTGESSNVRQLLFFLCQQLCYILNEDPATVPSDLKGVLNDFNFKLLRVPHDKKLFLFLDGLDRLSDENDGRHLTWLPRELPPSVRLFVSTVPDEKYECMKSLKKIYEQCPNAFLQVPDLDTSDGAIILDFWLRQKEKLLTMEQFDYLVNCFDKCRNPLFLRLSFQEALKWPSYQDPQKVILGDNVQKMTSLFFGRLERDHREPLVRRALGYLTAARTGVMESEMEDLLSLDDAVMDDICQYLGLSQRRLPLILWIRLRDALSPYLQECKADGCWTLRWAHTQFHVAAYDRYLNQRDKAPSYHKAMAEYYMGTWHEVRKPYSNNEKGLMRFVISQPLFTEPENSRGDGTDRRYNQRKLSELPYHLLNSQQMDKLKSEVLCNFEFMLSKLCATSLRSLLEEYATALGVEPNDIELKLLSDTLQMSALALAKDPRQLGGQIVGRLQNVITKDVPATAADPLKYPSLHIFLEQVRNSSMPTLVPSVSCLSEPGGVLFDLLSGHTDVITALTITTDGLRAITASKDETIKVWDLRSGRVTTSINGSGKNVRMIRTALNDTYIITSDLTGVRVWSMASGEVVREMTEFDDPATITTAAEGKLLVGIFDGINVMVTWDLENNINELNSISLADYGVHKDNSIVVANNSLGDIVLHALRGGIEAKAQSARSGKINFKLKCDEQSSLILALGVSRDYFVLACRQMYMKLHEIHILELFDTRKGVYLRSIRGCTHDVITELHINQVGSHAISVCPSHLSQTSNIAVWNLDTEDHKHLASHASLSKICACLDFRFCLTAGANDNALRIWNLINKVNQPAPKVKQNVGVGEIFPMLGNPRYVVAKGLNNGPITVWNVLKEKCLKSAVRIERGLVDPHDVVLFRKTKVVILTDRGFSSVTERSKPVFQTVLIYDLQAKKYDRKLTGCFINPSPVHEYTLLDGDLIMGLSDNRSHFILWSLHTGHVAHRIKTSFRDMDRRRKEILGSMGASSLSLNVGSLNDSMSITTGRRFPKTVLMTPWDLRTESKTAKEKRLKQEADEEGHKQEELRQEKDNAVDQYVMSGDQATMVVSFFAHHLCVFDIATRTHTHTLENEHSLMFLYVSALTFDGHYLVHTNYDEATKISYVTLWDCETGEVKRRLKNEPNVNVIAITDDGHRVVFGKGKDELRIWDPHRSNSMRRIHGYQGLTFASDSKIFIINNGNMAVVFAGDISMWDLENGRVMSVFTPDMKIQCCNMGLNGNVILFGLQDTADMIILKLMSNGIAAVMDTEGEEFFGETTGDTSDEDESDE